MRKDVPDRDMDLWRPLSSLPRPTPISTFRGGSEQVNETPTKAIQRTPVAETHPEAIPNTLDQLLVQFCLFWLVIASNMASCFEMTRLQVCGDQVYCLKRLNGFKNGLLRGLRSAEFRCSALAQKPQKPAAPVSLHVGEYEQPRPWRYVRWRKANDRQALRSSEQKADQPKGNFVYKVLPGEELADVAVKFDTYTEVLTEANKILNPHNVAIGQLLWVPKTHLIKRGNTLWSLSRSFGVSIATIQKANGIENPNLIFAGDILVIPEELD